MRWRSAICGAAAAALMGGVFAGVTAAQPQDRPPAQPGQSGQPGGQPGGQQPGGGRPGGPPGERGQQRPASAEAGMKTMGRSLSRLSKQIDAADKKDENIALVLDAQRGVVMARSATPKGPLAEEKDKDKLDAALKTYYTRLIVLGHKLLDLESAIRDGKTADAKKLLDETLKIRDDGHKELGVKEEEKK